jgi:dTDP-L-rhamnose 4-epimerase
VLVTGGAGFIGSHIVEQLADLGHEVRVLDSLHPAAHRTRPEYLHPRVAYEWGDVADPVIAARAVDGIDAVSHQAAMVGLGVDFADVTGYVASNCLGTASLLRALHAGAFRGRFVLASSMVVYGEGRYRCAEHGIVRPRPRTAADLEGGRFDPRCHQCEGPLCAEAVAEDAATDPRNVYAATKLHQEHLCRSFVGANPDAGLTVLRYHNVYGPRMPRDTPYAGVAGIFRSAIQRGEAPRVFEDGLQLRDFVNVRDVARANVLALTDPRAAGDTYNVASGTPRTVLDMADALVAAAGPMAPRPVVVGGGRAGDVRHVFASPERAERCLGYAAEVDFAEGMREFAGSALR